LNRLGFIVFKSTAMLALAMGKRDEALQGQHESSFFSVE